MTYTETLVGKPSGGAKGKIKRDAVVLVDPVNIRYVEIYMLLSVRILVTPKCYG